MMAELDMLAAEFLLLLTLIFALIEVKKWQLFLNDWFK